MDPWLLGRLCGLPLSQAVRLSYRTERKRADARVRLRHVAVCHPSPEAGLVSVWKFHIDTYGMHAAYPIARSRKRFCVLGDSPRLQVAGQRRRQDEV